MLNPSKLAALIAVTSLLAACSDSGVATAAKNDQSAALLSPAISGSMRPGLYRVVQTGDVEIEEERCITPDDVAAGRFAPPDSMSEGWSVASNRASAGRIEVSARHPDGARMTITGSYGLDSFIAEGELHIMVNGERHHIRTTQRGTLISSHCEEAFGGDV